MAGKTGTGIVKAFSERSKTKRPGVHSKNNTSRLKSSKNYKKAYRGQGK